VNQKENPDTILPIGFPETTFGDNSMNKKILVAYASANGSTGGVAGTISKTLANSTTMVDLLRVQSEINIKKYDAVVLGSAIHGGKWLPEAITFLNNNKIQLSKIPTVYFLVGLMVNKKSPEDRKLVDQFLADERMLVKPVAEGHFVGAFFPSKYSGITGFGMRFFIAYCGLGLRGGDFRNPDVIRSWAEDIRPLLIQ
jgi:menaquinone-dependent protoporphyrinogen oxidase